MSTQSQAPAEPQSQREALAEPTTRVRAGWIAGLMGANLAV